MRPIFLRPRPGSTGLVFSMPLYYGFTTGATLWDESGNGFTGTAVNSPVPSYPGFDFTRASSMYVDIGTGPTSVKTVALWVNPSASAGLGHALGSEKVQNTDLTSGNTGWTGEGEWVYQPNTYYEHKETGWFGEENVYPTMATAVEDTKTYTVTATFSALSIGDGVVVVSLGGIGKDDTANGENSWDITATNTDGLVIKVVGHYPTTTNMELVSVSVKEIVPAPLIDLNGTDFLTINEGVLTKNGFSGTTVLYVDSVADATTVTSAWHHIAITDTSAKNATDFDIGRIATAYFDGLIAGVRLYSSVLTAAEIYSLYQLTRWRFQK